MYVDLSLKENEATLEKTGWSLCMLGPGLVTVYVCYSRLTTYMYVDLILTFYLVGWCVCVCVCSPMKADNIHVC